jgi:hypothetical protein
VGPQYKLLTGARHNRNIMTRPHIHQVASTSVDFKSKWAAHDSHEHRGAHTTFMARFLLAPPIGCTFESVVSLVYENIEGKP